MGNSMYHRIQTASLILLVSTCRAVGEEKLPMGYGLKYGERVKLERPSEFDHSSVGLNWETLTLDLFMEDVEVSGAETWATTIVQLPPESAYLVKVEPKLDSRAVWAMSLFGCQLAREEYAFRGAVHREEDNGSGMQSKCQGPQHRFFGWAAPGTHYRSQWSAANELPDGVGFPVGDQYAIRYLVLEVSYRGVPAGGLDSSGALVHLSRAPVQRYAGTATFALGGFQIPARKRTYQVSNLCRYEGAEAMQIFALRVHTHRLGKSVALHKLTPGPNGTAPIEVPLLDRDPQQPQGFVGIPQKGWRQKEPQPPARKKPSRGLLGKKGRKPKWTRWEWKQWGTGRQVEVQPGEVLRCICAYSSVNELHPVRAGRRYSHEMCVMDLMFHASDPMHLSCRQFLHHGQHSTRAVGFVDDMPAHFKAPLIVNADVAPRSGDLVGSLPPSPPLCEANRTGGNTTDSSMDAPSDGNTTDVAVDCNDTGENLQPPPPPPPLEDADHGLARPDLLDREYNNNNVDEALRQHLQKELPLVHLAHRGGPPAEEEASGQGERSTVERAPSVEEVLQAADAQSVSGDLRGGGLWRVGTLDLG